MLLCLFLIRILIYGAPLGFLPWKTSYFMRAKEALASGISSINTIVCTVGGLSLPIVGSGTRGDLVFNDGVDFDRCVSFLIKEKYVLVDFVGSPGNILRGGEL